jgi:hypothetical protein
LIEADVPVCQIQRSDGLPSQTDLALFLRALRMDLCRQPIAVIRVKKVKIQRGRYQRTIDACFGSGGIILVTGHDSKCCAEISIRQTVVSKVFSLFLPKHHRQ